MDRIRSSSRSRRIALWWWHGHRAPAASTPHGGTAVGSAVRIPTVPTATAPARAEVSVSDAKGPLAKATVRFVSDDGEISVATANADGVAHAELAPGTWTISASAPGHLPERGGGAQDRRRRDRDDRARARRRWTSAHRTRDRYVGRSDRGRARRRGGARRAMRRRARRSRSTVTGADGKYALAVGEGEAARRGAIIPTTRRSSATSRSARPARWPTSSSSPVA